MVDLHSVLRQLRARLAKVDEAIQLFTQMQTGDCTAPTRVRKKRGRKGMTPAERQEVSERMRVYWAARRRERLVMHVLTP